MTAAARTLSALERDDFDGALLEALALWRATRSVGAAAVVAELGQRIPAPELADAASWGRRARKRLPGDVTALIANVGPLRGESVRGKLTLLAALPPDPRVARFLTGLVLEPPFTGPSLRMFWRGIVAELANHADRESHARLKAGLMKREKGVVGWFHEALGTEWLRRVELAERTWVTLPESIEDDLLERAKRLARPAPAAARDEESLRDEVAAHPDEDAPRLVLADYLSSRGDPRGEFIALQIADTHRALSRSETARMNQLLKAHRDTWLEELAPIAIKGETTFRRGFPSHFVSNHRAKPHLKRAALGKRVWATLESMVVTHGTYDHAAHPVAKNLRDIRWFSHEEGPLSRELVIALARGDVVRALRRIYLMSSRDAGEANELRAALERSVSFPALRELVLDAHNEATWIWEAPLARSLERAVLMGFPAMASEVGSRIRGCRAPSITLELRAATVSLDGLPDAPRATVVLRDLYEPGHPHRRRNAELSRQTMVDLIAGLPSALAEAVRNASALEP